jgi:Trk K+ transport system NAD-binding subunit
MLCYHALGVHMTGLPVADSESVPWHDHVVLCGLGTAGVRVAEGLLGAGTPLVIVDHGPPTPYRAAFAARGVPIVEGDCTNLATLRRAGVERSSAVLVVISDDLVNLQTALLARELHPGARIVIRLFNQRMAQHLRDLPVQVTALSLSAVAAPAFVLAAACPNLRGALTLARELWAVGRLTLPIAPALPGTLERWRQAGLVVVACSHAGGATLLCPPLDYIPPPGSRLLVVTHPARLQALGEDTERLIQALSAPEALPQLEAAWGQDDRVSRRSLPGRLAVLWLTPRLFWQRTSPFLRLALVALLALLASSVLVFHLFLSLSLVDALYFGVTLVTTVGLGDFNFQHASAWMKLYGVFVMLGGAALLTVIYALIVEFILDARLGDLVGARPDLARDHYVVAGLGTVGFRVVDALVREGEAVVVIESSESGRFLPQLRALGVPLVIGDAALEETLRRARVDQARALIAVTNNDLANLEAVLNARAIRPDIHAVLRAFDPDLAAQARQSLGIPASFSASQVAAPIFIDAALGYEASRILHLPVGLPPHQGVAVLRLEHLRCMAADGWCGQPIATVAAEQGGTALLWLPADPSGGRQFAPAGDAILEAGDTLVLAIPADGPAPAATAGTFAAATAAAMSPHG